MAADDWAVVVGVSRYPALQSLSGPELDARDFAEWLQASDGGDVPKNQIKLILSSDFPESNDPLTAEPTTVQIDRAFEVLYDLGVERNGKVGRRLYIYFAGHGFSPTHENAALLMANAARTKTGYHIPGRPYAEWFRRSAFFKEVVLFMDCCREHYPRAPVKVPPWNEQNSTRPGRYFYGFATEWSRASREGPYGSNGQVRGLFTLALLAGLRGGARRNVANQLTGSLLADFVFNYIRDRWKERLSTEDAQEPDFDYKTRGDIVFSAAQPAAPPPPAPTWTVHAKLGPGSRGKQVALIRGDLQALPATRVRGDRLSWEGLTQGLYRFHVAGQAGEWLQLVGQGGVQNVRL